MKSKHVLLALGMACASLTGQASNLGNFGAATQGEQDQQCLGRCQRGDSSCPMRCANLPKQQAPGQPNYQQPQQRGTYGTLRSEKSYISESGSRNSQCTYNVSGKLKTIVVQGNCPRSMKFK